MALAGPASRWSRCAWSTSRCARWTRSSTRPRRTRYMFGGQGRVPLVARMPIGIWAARRRSTRRALEAWFAHLPGLVVVTPGDAAGQLLAAARRDRLRRPGDLHGAQGAVGLAGRGRRCSAAALGKAHVAAGRQRRDARHAGRARCTPRSQAAESWRAGHRSRSSTCARSGRGIATTVLASCARTGQPAGGRTKRCRPAGFGAEIAATVAEELGCR